MFPYYRSCFSRSLPQDKDLAILDVGCGMGHALLFLRELGYSNISGIEVDEKQVKSAKNLGAPVELVSDVVKYLDERANRFSLIICLDVLEHVRREQQLAYLKAMRAALIPAGQLLLTVPNANSTFAARWRYNDWTHHTSFTEHSIDWILWNAGFAEIEVNEVEFHHRPGFSIRPIRRLVSGRFLGAHLRWGLFRLFRCLRRLELSCEIGTDEASKVPLSLNLLVTASGRNAYASQGVRRV